MEVNVQVTSLAVNEGLKTETTYTEDQSTYIKDHFGIETGDGILITRSQIDTKLPTYRRSCSLISPFGQDSFYLTTGFIFELPHDMIPWVNNGDAGSSSVSIIERPDSALSLQEYLSMQIVPNPKYTETVVDFGLGKSDYARAVYDFREIPPEPNVYLKYFSPEKYKKIQAYRADILESREEWKKVAHGLNIPFITSLPDTSIVERLRLEEKRTADNFSEYTNGFTQQ